ncbi:hypothetical protein GGI25_004160 [Coemansia spiralis]|uniref:Peptidase S1 domain-containing protein n=2 Tax=Coemansia TaxID=4863 RepID=A0A9W8G753_9FUNG|nr:trypsin-like cysteine/serine peptidase domain-containing protein [Coemansia spiralis]KAJ1987883.1 hypothetical protein EDC05_005614 [Coemansia umbellata]KAJ2620483.1 hypothetical protein GGI26_004971 [Coemansia sp. RSA 1358]KAJ2675012.1 hypothetical protein GGI25_004160 [Coemansia spiralis]
MYSLLLLFTLLAGILQAVAGLAIPLDKRIVNGFLMPTVFAPYTVSLLKKASETWYICGGSIISPNHIVTAAHCVVDTNGSAMPAANVSIGYNSIDKSKQTSVTSTKIFVHPQYASGSQRDSANDIAIVEVPTLKFGQNAERIAIYDGDIDSGQYLMAMGWGVTESNAVLLNILRGVLVMTGNTTDCQELNSAFNSNNGPQICTLGKLTPDHSTCGGDSGTSVVINYEGKQMLAGLDSIAVYPDGGSCGVATSAHFYVRVSTHLDFVTKATGLTLEYLTDESGSVNVSSQGDAVKELGDAVSAGDDNASGSPGVFVVTQTVLVTPTGLPSGY